ncbi:hypothetical protein ACQ4PT_046998 [Festuca glaucescens]
MTPSAKRKRRPAISPSAAAGSSDHTSPWASLHADLFRLVGWLVLAGDLLDYVRFRAVCMHWRSSTVCPRGRGIVDPRFHPRRWMLLPEGHGLHPDGDKKRFFNRSTGATACPRLPLLYGHGVLDSVDGLLLMYQQQKDHDKICLLNPFTGDIADLPPSVVASSREGSNLRARRFHVLPGHLTPFLEHKRGWSRHGHDRAFMDAACPLCYHQRQGMECVGVDVPSLRQVRIIIPRRDVHVEVPLT